MFSPYKLKNIITNVRPTMFIKMLCEKQIEKSDQGISKFS